MPDCCACSSQRKPERDGLFPEFGAIGEMGEIRDEEVGDGKDSGEREVKEPRWSVRKERVGGRLLDLRADVASIFGDGRRSRFRQRGTSS